MTTLVTRPREVPTPPWSMSRVATDVYQQLGPLTYPDPENGWALAALVEGWCTPASLLDDAIRPDRGSGEPAWTKVVDPERCPWWALRWCGQLYGLRLMPALTAWVRPDAATEERWRQEIRDRERWRRGTAAVIVAKIRKYLIEPTIGVSLRLRYNPALGSGVDAPWHVQIRVRASNVKPGQTAALTRDVSLQQPAGVVFHLVIADEQTWDDLVDARSDWNAVTTANATWDATVTG